MARTRLNPLPAPPAVFLGGMLGGALRLGIDSAIPPLWADLPLDLVAINLVGAFALGGVTAWIKRHGQRPWVPMVGTGALGAFTTFSALAALPWVSTAPLALSAVVGVGTIVGAIGAAALGWHVSDRLAHRQVGERA